MFNPLLPINFKILSTGRPEAVLRRSMKILGAHAIQSLTHFIKSRQTSSGGFADKAGKADLYYTLFGVFVAEALGLDAMLPSCRDYVEITVKNDSLTGVHIHCAAILASKLDADKRIKKILKSAVREDITQSGNIHTGYHSFLHLLTSLYTRDFRTLWSVKRKITSDWELASIPGPVISARLVMQSSFRKPVAGLEQKLMTYYHEGGFKATQAAPIPDLLSTAVSLFALNHAGYDLKLIKPDCLDFVDSLFTGEGFSGNIIDNDPDVEYTFYGLLALGALAD